MSREPNYEFQEWWNKQREQNHELFTNDTNNPNNGFLTVEISSPNPDRTANKDRARSVRQLSWVSLLRFQRLANSLASITNASILFLRTANHRISSADSPSYSSTFGLYRIIKFFLFLVLPLLCVELLAYFKGWHFSRPSGGSAEAAVELVYAKWLEIRADYWAPPLQSLANVCIVLFLIQSVYCVVLTLGCFWIKFRGLKPTAAMEYPVGRVEGENVEDYPMVLVQIPMCNEREVCQQSIAAVCIMDWPRDRMLVQVLDDSDNLDVQLLIKAEVQKWQQRGVHILYRHGLIRTGYKPAPDFLKKTIPYSKASEPNAESNEKRCKSTESKGNENGSVKAEEDAKGSNGNARDEKQNKTNNCNNTKPPEPPKDHIHVRARRGPATDSHSLAERVRREKISERMKLLQNLVPGCNKVTGKALMLDEIINYVQSLQRQVEFLSVKLASANTRLDVNVDGLMSKDIFQPNNTWPHPIFPINSSASAFFGHQPQQNPALHSNFYNGTMTQRSVDPLVTAICPNLNTHVPPINQFTENVPQYPTLCEDDLQTIVQMGFGQNQSQEMGLQSENFQGSNQVSHMKGEL